MQLPLGPDRLQPTCVAAPIGAALVVALTLGALPSTAFANANDIILRGVGRPASSALSDPA
ncbi:MAG: hypothetical protein AAF658_14370, partial [Myxococcota bacterium]